MEALATTGRERVVSSSSDEHAGVPMEVTYNIRGDAAGAVIGKAKSTLWLIKDSTKCMMIEVGGNRGDEY